MHLTSALLMMKKRKAASGCINVTAAYLRGRLPGGRGIEKGKRMSIHTTLSPDGRVSLAFFVEEGRISYEVRRDGILFADRAPLGIVQPDADLSTGLTLKSEKRGEINEVYRIAAFKKSECVDHCNTITLSLEKEKKKLEVEGRVFDDGAAFRLRIRGRGKGEADHEVSAFRLPENVENVYGMKWLCSYEDHYHPVPVEDLYQNMYAFPMLAHIAGRQWALYAEAAVFGNYGGSILSSAPEDPALLRVTKAVDKLDTIKSAYPLETPWRVIVTGDLNMLTGTNILENLNPGPITEDTSFIQPGAAAWSWMSEHSSPRDSQRMHDYVDFAAEMGWPYSIVDGGWPGHIDIPELVEYAAEKNVKIWVWEHSQAMRDPKTAEEKMKLWKSWGVVGIKIDFFESDSQERVAQYGMLAELAAKYRLMLNFHGCMKPSGTSRVWPHVLSYEAVQGEEYLANFSTFTPMGPDAAHNCTLPFTRNIMGPMDYTPITYESYLTGTSDTHQTALPVIFLSYITHCGEGKEKVERNLCAPFLKKLRTSWDEGKLLEGYPANYVTMARRSGSDWFIGGICARRPRNAEIVFDFLTEEKYQAELYCDDLSDMYPSDAANGALGPMLPEHVAKLEALHSRPCQHQHDLHKTKVIKMTVKKGQKLTIPETANGGFAMYLTPVK